MTQSVECFLSIQLCLLDIRKFGEASEWINKQADTMWIGLLARRKKLFHYPKVRKIKPHRMFAAFCKIFTCIDRRSLILGNMPRCEVGHMCRKCTNDDSYLVQESQSETDDCWRTWSTVNIISYQHSSQELIPSEVVEKQINYFQISQTNQSSPWLIADGLCSRQWCGYGEYFFLIWREVLKLCNSKEKIWYGIAYLYNCIISSISRCIFLVRLLILWQN